ncbi:MAG: hypothetical protein Q4G07_01960 [Oscillospiraceae bacterium]|nr:hypothetical protein [Oscillospiraceae bacterium]
MKTFVGKLYTGFARTKAAYCIFCAALYLTLTALSGGSLLQWALFCLAVLFYLYLPGRFFVRLSGVEKEFSLFRAPCALVCGAGFLAVLYCFTMRLGVLWLLWAVPPVLAAAEVFLALQKRKSFGPGGLSASKRPLRLSSVTPNGWLLALLYCSLVLLYTFTSVVKNAHPTAVGDILLNHDFLWNVGNANAFQLAFPPQDIRFYNVRLSYHYLSEMLSGIFSLLTGIPAYDIIGFYLQPLVLLALVSGLYLFARFFYRDKPLPVMLFTFSMFLFSCASLWKILPNGWSVFNNSNIQHLITNINAQATAIVLLCCYAGLFLNAARLRFQVSWRYLALTLCAFVLLGVGKGPVAAIVAVASVLTVLFLLAEKKAGFRGALLAAGVAAAFGALYLALFSSGANNSMTFSFSATLEQGYFKNILQALYPSSAVKYWLLVPVLYVVQTALTLPAQFLLYVRSIGHDVKRLFHVEAGHLFCHACAAGGLLAYYLFSHPHMSQIYFLFLAVFCINLLACDGLDALRWPKRAEGVKKSKAVCKKVWLSCMAGLCAVGVVTTGFLYINFFGSGGRQFFRNMGWAEKYDYAPYTSVMTPDDEAAMLWLRANTSKDDMFATNRIHTGRRLEGISNLYSALSGRQAFMEGFQYAVTNMGVSEAAVSERIAENALLFDPSASKEDILAVCRKHGITYLVFSPQQAASDVQQGYYSASDDALREYFSCVYDSASCRIYATGTAAVPRG